MKLVAGVLALAFVADAQNILTVLEQQDGVSQFTDILAQYSDLVDYLNTGVHTLLVPTDAAISQAKSSKPDVFADDSHTRALVEYHILKDTHPSATFTNASQLIPTLLTNTTYTNVTGGQRVELLEKDGHPTFLSAVKAESKIFHGDVFYVGGIVHIIDSVLQIPLSFPSTITKTNLTHLVALLNRGNWLTPNSIAYKLAVETPDLTILGPNNEAYGADFTGWDNLTQDQLDQIFLYHSLQEVVYSTDMKNNSQFPTLANETITTRNYGEASTMSAIFLNNAHLIGPNYITSNGVFQVIDRPLDPTDSTAAPSTTDINTALGLPTKAPSKGISTAAIVGIVIGILATLIAMGLILALRARVRRRRQQRQSTLGGAVSSSSYRQMPPTYQSATSDSRRATQRLSVPPTRVNAPLPARPRSVARSIASIPGALWPSRPPQNNVVELDAKDYHIHVSELGSEASNSVQNRSTTHDGSTAGPRADAHGGIARPPQTPPELDGVQKSRRGSPSARSHVSITFHGDKPRHIGFQAQY